MWTCFVVLLSGVVALSAHKPLPLPPYLKPCKNDADFDACALKHAKLALPYILKGDKKYGIPSFNPLKITEVALDTSGNLKLKLKNVDLYGFERSNLKKVKVDIPAKKFFLEFEVDVLTILGNYEMDGKILVLPLKGNGDVNITAHDLYVTYDFSYTIVERDRKHYLDIGKQNVDFTISRLHVDFKNLFNGDKNLGDNTNEVLNREWKTLLVEMKPSIAKTISTIALSIIKGIFDRVPQEELLARND